MDKLQIFQGKKIIYRKAIIKYGYIPLLLLLDNYEHLEDFEECQLIKESIDEYCKEYGIRLSTKYSKESLEEFKNFGRKGELMLMNLPLYANDIYKEIKIFENNSRKRIEIQK